MKKIKQYGVWGLVVVSCVFLLIGLLKLAFSINQGSSGKPPEITESDQVKGTLNASVVVIEYSDYQCPACKFYQPIVNQITSEYKDKIAFVYRHFPLPQHQNALVAAYTAEAAAKQRKFWEMNDLLFENQEEWAEKGNVDEIFKSYASKLGLDPNKFAEDMKNNAVREKVNKDKSSGEVIGVNATPTFYLNGVKLKNIRNYDDLKRYVDQELNRN